MRVAVLGCGSIGKRHLRNLKALGVTDLFAFDPVEEARQIASAELDITGVGKLAHLWTHAPDVVIVAAPTNLHLELAMAAVQRNCHVFIEKPLSHSLEGVSELLAIAEQNRLVTMVGCNMRFHPGPTTVKRLIAENSIGSIIAARIQTGSYLPRWRPGLDYRQSYSASSRWGGAILDCIHEIDLALWYFGPAEVAGCASLTASTIGIETDGLTEIILRHHTGVLCNVHLNFVQRDYIRNCQIIGCEGTIYWDFGQGQVTMYGPGGQLERVLPQPTEWDVNRMYLDEMRHFLDAVRKNEETVNPITGGLAALEIALTVRKEEMIR